MLYVCLSVCLSVCLYCIALSCHAMPCPVLSCPTTPCQAKPNPTLHSYHKSNVSICLKFDLNVVYLAESCFLVKAYTYSLKHHNQANASLTWSKGRLSFGEKDISFRVKPRKSDLINNFEHHTCKPRIFLSHKQTTDHHNISTLTNIYMAHTSRPNLAGILAVHQRNLIRCVCTS